MSTCMEKKYRRQELLNEPGVPTQGEIRNNLGAPLAEIFFNSLDETCQQLLGLAPPIIPPHNRDLWVSPSDTLLGKVMLTPPMPTRRVTRAVTHKGILEIGGECLYKIENEARLDKERCLAELEASLRQAAALELERAVQLAREEEREIHEREIQALLDSFRETLKEAIEETETRLLKTMAARVQEERREIHDLMQDQQEAAVEETERRMTEQFRRKLMKIIQELNEYYHEYIYMMADHFNWRLRLEAHNNAQYVMQLRFTLETQYEIDISYAVCRERQCCELDKDRITKEFTEQIAELNKVILNKIAELEEEKSATQRALLKCSEWEERIRQIIREFQKFINFTMKAVPGQAEFLLSLEKLLILEMQRPEAEPEPEPEPEPEEVALPLEELPEEETEVLEGMEEEMSTEGLLEPEMQMATQLQDTRSEGEEIATTLLGELISVTTSMSEVIAKQLLDRIVKKSVPPNTEEEEIIGGILEKLIENATPLGEDVVQSVIELLIKGSTPMPEGEQVVIILLQDMIEKAMGPEMFDAATQAPPISEHKVTILDATEVHYLMQGLADNPEESEITITEILATAEDSPTDGESPATEETLPTAVPPNIQECAWCEIKETQSPGKESLLTDNLAEQQKHPETARTETDSSRPEPPTQEADMRPEDVSFQDRGLVGEGGHEHQQEPEEFVADRVQALLEIFRKHPSVAQIFVPHCGI